MEKEKILLIVGCSHAGGYEIDGDMESEYNRTHSFGNKLADRLRRTPINLSHGGLSNQGIARSAMRWIDREWNPQTQDLMVLVCWTEASRLEVPVKDNQMQYYDSENSAHKLHVNNMYFQVNMSWTGGDDEEEARQIKLLQSFMGEQYKFLETLGAMQVLLLQNLFDNRNIPYLMCNTMHMFTPGPHLANYSSLIETDRYYNAFDNSHSFFWYYRNLGYENPKALYWHHDETPHELYAQELYDFYKQN